VTLAQEIAHDSGALRGKRYRWRAAFVAACHVPSRTRGAPS